MPNKTTTEVLRVLTEIKEKGYIPSENNNVFLYHQKINHALAAFFNALPIEPTDAVECMSQLTRISQNTRAFFSLFPKTMMDLYDWAASGDALTQRFAETQLLLFFSHTSPDSVEQKNRLLTDVQKMPDLLQRKLMVAKVITQVADHYDQNGQFNEDPGLSVLKPLSDILHQFSDSGKTARTRNTTAEEKAYCRTCAALIKEHAPTLYEELWQEQFAPPAPRKYSVPKIAAPVDAYVFHRYRHTDFSRGWDRE